MNGLVEQLTELRLHGMADAAMSLPDEYSPKLPK